jgi:hypothetical protein
MYVIVLKRQLVHKPGATTTEYTGPFASWSEADAYAQRLAHTWSDQKPRIKLQLMVGPCGAIADAASPVANY